MFQRAIRIGRLFGIDLKVDTSWLFILGLVVYSLTNLFGRWHPAWTTATNLSVAIVAAMTFFASVLLHELAHSLVARLVYKIPVHDITLHMFGGVSNIEKEPPTPGAELLIAIVGPITSIGLGVAMLFGGAALTGAAVGATGGDPSAMLGDLSPTATMLMWLGPVNVGIGLFNMIPGFPLDGGRVLRAILWKLRGNMDRATRSAATVGQAIGLAFMIMGGAMALGLSVPVFGRGFGSGLWLVMIGMFLRGAARQQEAGAMLRELLRDVRVVDVMRPYLGWSRPVEMPGVVHVTPPEPLADALGKLAESEERQVPVVEDGMLVGMLFQEDVARWIHVHAGMGGGPGSPRTSEA